MSEAPGVTEFVFMHVSKGSKPGEGQETLFDSPAPGFISARYGWQIEDPSVFHWSINWETLDHHKAFMATPEYPAFIEKITAWAPDVSLFHAALSPHPTNAAFEGLTTELVKLHLKEGVTKEQMMESYPTFEESLKKAKGYHAHSIGWSIEDENCAVVVIGWDSKEAHTEWTKTEDGNRTLRGPEGLLLKVGKIEMWHIKDGGAIVPPNLAN